MDQVLKSATKKEFQLHESDTGSPEVQIALITRRIEGLTDHLRANKKDHHSRYGLIKMVSARRRLLNYIKRNDEERYQNIIKRLSLRH